MGKVGTDPCRDHFQRFLPLSFQNLCPSGTLAILCFLSICSVWASPLSLFVPTICIFPFFAPRSIPRPGKRVLHCLLLNNTKNTHLTFLGILAGGLEGGSEQVSYVAYWRDHVLFPAWQGRRTVNSCRHLVQQQVWGRSFWNIAEIWIPRPRGFVVNTSVLVHEYQGPRWKKIFDCFNAIVCKLLQLPTFHPPKLSLAFQHLSCAPLADELLVGAFLFGITPKKLTVSKSRMIFRCPSPSWQNIL